MRLKNKMKSKNLKKIYVVLTMQCISINAICIHAKQERVSHWHLPDKSAHVKAAERFGSVHQMVLLTNLESCCCHLLHQEQWTSK